MKIIEFEKSINKVINILEAEYTDKLNDGVLQLIYKRYKNSLNLIKDNELDSIRIMGGVRAYLDSYSDYTCPLVMAMDEAETIYDEIMK